MKKYLKYLLGTIIFFIVYTTIEYVVTENINWKMVIVSTLLYAFLYTLIDLIFNKVISNTK